MPEGRQSDGPDHAPAPDRRIRPAHRRPNNGHRHEQAITTLIKDYGLLHEAELIPRSYGGNSWFGKFHPAAGKELLSSLPVAIRGVMKRKINPKIAIFGHKIGKQDLKAVQNIYAKVESRPERYELNLYVSGEDE